jgi:hypothetical protein
MGHLSIVRETLPPATQMPTRFRKDCTSKAARRSMLTTTRFGGNLMLQDVHTALLKTPREIEVIDK